MSKETSPHTQALRVFKQIEGKFFNRPTENAGTKELRKFEDAAMSKVHDYSGKVSAQCKKEWQNAVMFLSDKIDGLCWPEGK